MTPSVTRRASVATEAAFAVTQVVVRMDGMGDTVSRDVMKDVVRGLHSWLRLTRDWVEVFDPTGSR
jgi:hypothetical protein